MVRSWVRIFRTARIPGKIRPVSQITAIYETGFSGREGVQRVLCCTCKKR